MVDGRTRLAADVAGEVRRHFGALVFDVGAELGTPRGGAEPGLPAIAYDQRLRRGRGLLEGGDGACPARFEPARPRPRPRGAHRRRRGGEELAKLPVDSIAANPRQPAGPLRGRCGGGLAESVRAQGLLQPVVVRPRPGRLRADRGRAALARGADGRPGDRAGGRPGGRRPRLAAPRARRERRPREAVPGRRGACLCAPPRRVRPLARRGGGARRAVEAVGLESRPAARPPRRPPLDWSSGRPHRGHARAVLAVPEREGRSSWRSGSSSRGSRRKPSPNARHRTRARSASHAPERQSTRRSHAFARRSLRRMASRRASPRAMSRSSSGRARARRAGRSIRTWCRRLVHPDGRGVGASSAQLLDPRQPRVARGDLATADAKRIFLRMAAMSQGGRLPQFLDELAFDPSSTTRSRARSPSSPATAPSCSRSRTTFFARSVTTSSGYTERRGRLAQLVRAPL